MKLNDHYRGGRILLVDDDKNTRYLDCMMLSGAGYTVDAAADGEEAWKMLLSIPYDLLLSDHNMPRLCGLDLVARMRAAGMTLPIIINSGCFGLEEASNHAHLELAAVLHKPSDFTAVLDAVKRILPLASDRAEKTPSSPEKASHSVPLGLVNLVPAPRQPACRTT